MSDARPVQWYQALSPAQRRQQEAISAAVRQRPYLLHTGLFRTRTHDGLVLQALCDEADVLAGRKTWKEILSD